MPTFEQQNLQGFLNRLNSNTLTAGDQAILTQTLTAIIAAWGNQGISVDPNTGVGTDPAPVDDEWFSVLYSEALGVATGGGLTPASWAQTTWFIDPQNVSGTASDTASGATSATALRTWAQLVARWGTTSPTHRATVTVTFLSSHTDNTDPVIWNPILANGASAILQGSPTLATSTIFTLNTAKNRAAGANALLSGSFAAGAPAPGVLLQNTTAGKVSRAWVYKAAGGANFSLTQPMTLQTVPGITNAEVNTWASGDSVNLLALQNVNVVSLQPTVIDFNGAFSNAVYVYQLNVFDPTGATNDNLIVSSPVRFVECSTQRAIASTGLNAFSQIGIQINNLFNNGGMISPNVTVSGVAGAITNLATVNGSNYGNVPGLDGDMIFGGTTLFPNGAVLGPIFLDGGIFVNSGILAASASELTGIPCVIYGSGTNTVNMRGQSRFLNATGNTFTATLTAPGLVTGMTLNGAATGHSVISGAPDTYNGNISTTPAHLDAAAGAAGFGGLAFNPGGASIALTA